jgi:hypothetical protein
MTTYGALPRPPHCADRQRPVPAVLDLFVGHRGVDRRDGFTVATRRVTRPALISTTAAIEDLDVVVLNGRL